MSASRDSINDVWGERTSFGGLEQWPVRVDEEVVETPERWVQSACVLCTNGCGLDIGVKGNRIFGVRGRGDDPINRGRLGPKGLHGSSTGGAVLIGSRRKVRSKQKCGRLLLRSAA